jgi:hypothetical protein
MDEFEVVQEIYRRHEQDPFVWLAEPDDWPYEDEPYVTIERWCIT